MTTNQTVTAQTIAPAPGHVIETILCGDSTTSRTLTTIEYMREQIDRAAKFVAEMSNPEINLLWGTEAGPVMSMSILLEGVTGALFVMSPEDNRDDPDESRAELFENFDRLGEQISRLRDPH